MKSALFKGLMARFNAAELLPEPSLGLCPCLLCGGSLFSSNHTQKDSKCSQTYICKACFSELPWLTNPCELCALPLPVTSGAQRCGECLQKPPLFTRIEAPWLYEPPIAQLIVGFKHNRRYSYGEALATIAAQNRAGGTLPDWICPTPLHWLRHLKRGFNQSQQLADCYSRHTGIAVKQCLQRINHTPAQQGLDAEQRKRNLRGSFRVAGKAVESIKGKRIAVIDDVVTTCATANEISRCLLDAGAAEVQIWCLARTPKPS